MCRTGFPGLAAVLALAATVMSQGALAQEVKVGVVLPYTGVGAELGQQMDRGLELYLKLNADQVKPYKITLIKRDSKAPDGVGAKVAVQELLTQDKVDAIVGFSYSPDAIASAPVISAGQVPETTKQLGDGCCKPSFGKTMGDTVTPILGKCLDFMRRSLSTEASRLAKKLRQLRHVGRNPTFHSPTLAPHRLARAGPCIPAEFCAKDSPLAERSEVTGAIYDLDRSHTLGELTPDQI